MERPDRTAVAAAIDRMRLPQLALWLRRAASPRITVLTYHRVSRRGQPGVLDEGVVDVAPEALERHLAFVRRWFDVVDLDALLEHVRGRVRLPRNPLLVTFDDGYRDNHDVALPILLRHGVRATFFVAVDYVEERRLYWWDRVALALGRSTRERVSLRHPSPLELPLAGAQARREAIRRAQRIVKDHRGLDLERFLEDLESAAGVTLGREEELRLVDDTVMTWEHVAALQRAGMHVQSHTRSHRVLQTLDDRELRRELHGSRERLEAVLGRPVRAVSYPVGKPLGGEQRIRRAVRDAGYELGFSNGTGVNRADAFDPLDARRLALDAELGEPFFRAMLALPWMAY